MCYCKVKQQYKAWPSARASQAIAKCRKTSGTVVKSDKGKSLRRWAREKWKDTITGKPCGETNGKGVQYCRPSKKVSKKTPKIPKGDHLKQLQDIKKKGGHPQA